MDVKCYKLVHTWLKLTYMYVTVCTYGKTVYLCVVSVPVCTCGLTVCTVRFAKLKQEENSHVLFL